MVLEESDHQSYLEVCKMDSHVLVCVVIGPTVDLRGDAVVVNTVDTARDQGLVVAKGSWRANEPCLSWVVVGCVVERTDDVVMIEDDARRDRFIGVSKRRETELTLSGLCSNLGNR